MKRKNKDYRLLKRGFLADILKLKEADVKCANCSADPDEKDWYCEFAKKTVDPEGYCNDFLPKGID